MAKVTALGLASIEVADVAKSKGTEVWAKLGLTYENTCKMIEEDSTDTEFYAEEEDDPQEVITKRGKTTVSWSIMNLTAATCEKVFGGKYDSPSKTWSAPATMNVVEKAVKITPRIGCTFVIPRTKFKAKITADFSKQGLFLAECSAVILNPGSDRGRIEITDPTEASSAPSENH